MADLHDQDVAPGWTYAVIEDGPDWLPGRWAVRCGEHEVKRQLARQQVLPAILNDVASRSAPEAGTGFVIDGALVHLAGRAILVLTCGRDVPAPMREWWNDASVVTALMRRGAALVFHERGHVVTDGSQAGGLASWRPFYRTSDGGGREDGFEPASAKGRLARDVAISDVVVLEASEITAPGVESTSQSRIAVELAARLVSDEERRRRDFLCLGAIVASLRAGRLAVGPTGLERAADQLVAWAGRG